MKATDVRIGNWVNSHANWNDDKAHFEVCKVSDIGEEEFFTSATGIDGNCTTHHIPIPLTEQWLIDFNFDVCGEFYILSGMWSEDINISIIHEKTTFGCNEEYSIGHIKYVHQLQNLYFALTGLELTIKET